MENFITLAIPALLSFILIRLLFVPMKWVLRLALHGGCGLLCLWLLNTVSGFTGLILPINAVTVLLAGTLGAPGIALIALLELL
jgi:inhibitor of the pro-sigma K processing machinery